MIKVTPLLGIRVVVIISYMDVLDLITFGLHASTEELHEVILDALRFILPRVNCNPFFESVHANEIILHGLCK